jgi:coenzyme F420-reducing hydrogenase alpha subunit
MKKLLDDSRDILETAINLGELFVNLKYPDFQRKTTFVSLYHPDEYAIYDGKIKIDGRIIEKEEFYNLIKEVQYNSDVVKKAYFEDQIYMVGALARLNNHKEQLNPQAKELLEESKLKFPCYNPFYNILAQAIEVVHCLEEAIKILERLLKQEKLDIAGLPAEVPAKTGQGIGIIEAPRGLLIYKTALKEGMIENVNIITPTAQNLANLEADLEEIEHLGGFDKLTREQKEDKIKMLIRAYDPCVTCAVH